MKKSAFIPTFGNRPDILVGRDVILTNFMEGLAHPEGHPFRTTIIKGQRGMGKTALLLEIADRAEKKGYIAVCVAANENMLEEILQLLVVKSERHINKNKKIQGMNAGAFGFSLGFTFSDDVQQNFGFRLKLTMLADEWAKHKKGILILVDEAQANSPKMRELAVTYQHLIGEGKNIAIAIAGLPGVISNVLHDDILTFLNRAYKVILEPLHLNEISVFYSERFSKEGKTIDAGTLNFVVKSTHGYPYLMQLIGFYIMRYSKDSKVIEKNNAELAVISAKRDLVGSVFEPCLKPLSVKDKVFLKAMAIDKNASRTVDIQTRMKVSAAYLQQYRSRLIEAGVIISDTRGSVEFAVPYLGEYLRGEISDNI